MGKAKKSKKGFTIIELIAVVAIIGGLVAMLAPVVTKQITKAKKGRIEADVNAIEKGTILHFADTSQYPANGTLGSCSETGNQIDDLLNNSDALSGWDGAYLDKQNTRFGTTYYGVGCTYSMLGCTQPAPPDINALLSYTQFIVVANAPAAITTAIDTDLDDGDTATGRVQTFGTDSTCMVIGTAAE